MEGRKPNQISIKMNGSHLSKQAAAPKAEKERRAPIQHTPIQLVPVQNDQPEPAQSDYSPTTPEEDALSRLNELRERVEIRGEDSAYEGALESESSHERISYLDDSFSEEMIRSTGRTPFWRQPLPPFTRRPWFRIAASSIGAVLLGLVFGFGVLTVFKQEQLAQSYKTVLGGALQLPQEDSVNHSQPTIPNSNTVPAVDNPSAVGGQSPESEKVQTVLSIPEQNLFLAQAGVFSDVAAAQSVIDPLTKEGYPHFFYPMEGKQHLFVAMAPSRDEILGIASFLKKNQMDIYVKEITLPMVEKEVSLSKSLVNTDPKTTDKNQVETFLASGFAVVKSLSTYSSRVLNQEATGQPITPEEEKQLRELHRQFVDQGRVVLAGVPNEWQPYFKRMVDGLSQAVTALNGLKTSNAQSYAWQAQNGVFQYLTNYLDWTQKVMANP